MFMLSLCFRRYYSRCQNQNFSYDPHTNQWKSAGPMRTTRKNIGASELDGLIYAIGGSEFHSDTMNIVEKYTTSLAVTVTAKFFSSDMTQFATVGRQLLTCSQTVGVCRSLS